MTQNIINMLRERVYGADADEASIKRLTQLYSVLFDSVSLKDIDEVTEEILECEKRIAGNYRDTDANYDEFDLATVIKGYSAVAYTLAGMRYRTGAPILAADYLFLIYEELLGLPGFTDSAERLKLRRLISETLMDFSYASGRTDNMSIRLHNLTM